MMLQVKCHKCHAEYELEDSMAGKFLECKCGENLTVGEGVSASASKECLKCHAQCEIASVICVSCGYNFRTGQAVTTSDSDDEETEGLWWKIFPLIKPLSILFVMGLVALLVYRGMTYKHYGISSSTPIGTFAELDEVLQAMRLEKSPASALPEGFGCEAQLFTYSDKIAERKSRGTINESVFVVTDKQGDICGIGGSFTVLDSSVPSVGSKIMRFLKDFLSEAEFPKPTFKEQRKGNRMFSWLEQHGEVEIENYKAIWTKEEATGVPLVGSSDNIIVLRKGLSPKYIFPFLKDNGEIETGE